MDIIDILGMIGAGFVILIVILIMIFPIIAIFILGHYTATQYLHLTGLVYWSYIVIFFCVIGGFIGMMNRIARG